MSVPHCKRIGVEFREYSIIEKFQDVDGTTFEVTLNTTKPINLKVLGNMTHESYDYVFAYKDSRHDANGPFQALLFLCTDLRGESCCYFINEKGHPSGYHGGWHKVKQCFERAQHGIVVFSEHSIDFHVLFHCMATRGTFRTLQLHGVCNPTLIESDDGYWFPDPVAKPRPQVLGFMSQFMRIHPVTAYSIVAV